MSALQLESVQEDPRNLPLKFGQNRASNSWDIANYEFMVGGGGVKLSWGWVGVLTILILKQSEFKTGSLVCGILSHTLKDSIAEKKAYYLVLL